MTDISSASGLDPVYAKVRELICEPIERDDPDFYTRWLADPTGFAIGILDSAGAESPAYDEFRTTVIWLSNHWAEKLAATTDPDAMKAQLKLLMTLIDVNPEAAGW